MYYATAAAAPLLALGLVAAPAFAHGMSGARPEFTDEQRTILEQVRELHKQGKRDEARALLESAGVPARPRMMKFRAHPSDEKMREHHQAVQDAIKNGDYAAFQELAKDAPFAGKIDEAAFTKMTEAGVKPFHPHQKMGVRFFKGFRDAR